ncbi:MAG: ABC transporter ATP-binding protein/permease [Oscillospiraceae bacterium]|nr:ABC transporter ATP-binding protein/permease [Oscillospiraceae bacterium]
MIKAFFSTLRTYRLKYARFAALYILPAAAAAVAGLLSARATGDMAQAAELGLDGEMMGFLLVLAVAGAAQVLLDSLTALLRQRAFGAAIHRIRAVFTRRLLDMPYRDFAAKNSGEGVSLFTNDAPLAAEFVTTQALAQISQFATLLVSAVFMAYINGWLTLVYFALFPLLAVFQAKLSAPIGKKRLVVSERRAETVAVVADALQNPLTVKAYGLEAAVERRFDESFMKCYRAEYEASKISVPLLLTGVFTTFLPTAALGMAACALVIRGEMTLAGFVTLTVVSGPVGSWLMMFAQDLARLQLAKASAMRVMEFTPDTAAGEGIRMDTAGKYAAVFDDVRFGYSEDAMIFEGVSFAVDQGSVTAVAGPSGCGKSTALKLMLGLYAPDGGRISLSSPHVTYVPQDGYLLPVSIRENIIGNLPDDEDKLRAACENAGIYEFITGLPEGFDAVLSESAANVSGGQKQRIAMARAFYRDADILLFDEATSALDPATERAVLEAFRDYVKTGGKTAVVVAHRQAVLEMADRVVTLTKGGGAG